MTWNTDGINVWPEADLRPHVLSDECWCHPTDDEGILVHHSMDKREDFENGRSPS